MAKRRSEAAPATPVPPEVAALVERFADHREAYRAGTYNEAQLRREFIDPLFKALGWDVDNTAGYAEAYKDVIHEDSIRIGGAVKAPDYCFRIGGARKFFLEAKKPSVDIKGDPTPAYQLRRYAWSGKLPLSILTDFEEFAVYDCRVKPDKGDKSSTARIAYYTFDQFTDPKVWGEIASVFAREAILKGSFDRYAQSTKRKRGTAEVDDAFLAEIEQWRDELARNIALRNADITQRQLNTAVQLTVDRIIFLRICEDRGIEDYGRLQALLNGERVYERLFEHFEQADKRYNSGLFYFQAEAGRGEPDTLTPKLAIDDKVLKGIIKGLYYPDSPYEFSVLSADILGHVYEQFLGKVIRLTKGHRAQIEEKPEVRKAGGVYYTPTYIVDYIVTNTVGKLLEGQSVKWIGTEKGRAVDQPRLSRTLRVLDPACGSGSFLIGAYQHLLDWHLKWYLEHEPEKWAKRKRPPIAANQRGEYRLTIPERKRILLEHIYGVDIDAQAVEVTKLSLLLKVLEGETAHSLGTHLWYEKERALPDLSGNVKCGNSLIGPDFYDKQQQMMFDEEERYRINAFDWRAEFAEVFAGGRDEGGFDAVIGNPPYVQIENIPADQKRYFLEVYGDGGSLGKRYDLYQVFVLRGIANLRCGGRLGLILPNTFLMGHSYTLLRRRILAHCHIVEIVDLPQGVFRGVTVDNVLLFLRRAESEPEPSAFIRVNKLYPKSDKSRLAKSDWDESFPLRQVDLHAERDHRINLHVDPTRKALFHKMAAKASPLGDITDSSQGIILYRTTADAERSAHTGFESQPNWKKLLRGRQIGRYETKWAGEYVNYGPWLWCARDERYFNRDKILLHAMRNKSLARRLVGTLDTEQYYNAHNLANIIVPNGSQYDLRYILGLFNSTLINYWYKAHFPNVNINPSDFRQIPIPRIEFDDSRDKARHDRLVCLVQRMLDLHKGLAGAKTAHERTVIERDIGATDRQIDRLVYDLYGLTEEEIAVVEEATK